MRNLQFILETADDAMLKTRVEEYRRACELRLSQGSPTTPTTLAQELEINPFLRAQTVEEFTFWRQARNAWA